MRVEAEAAALEGARLTIDVDVDSSSLATDDLDLLLRAFVEANDRLGGELFVLNPGPLEERLTSAGIAWNTT